MDRSKRIVQLGVEQALRERFEENSNRRNTSFDRDEVHHHLDPFHAFSDEDSDYELSDTKDFEPESETSVASGSGNIPNSPQMLENLVVQEGNTERVRRKRKRPEQWRQNIRKQKRNSGQQYVTKNNIVVRSRKPKESCHNNCVYNCTNQIEMDGRQAIFDDFWRFGDLQRQRDYIAARVNCHESGRTRVENSRRKFSREYYFCYLNQKYRVCKKFFLNTLDISEKMMRTVVLKAGRSFANVPSPDCRGKHPPGIKLSDDVIRLTEQHIESFPTVPAHWCRRDSKKVYLDSILNKEKMYSLYLEFCNEKKMKPVSRTFYREMLIKKNIEFYHPRKDQCWCYEFELKSEDYKIEHKENYELHIKRKDAANLAKKEDGDKARIDKSFVSVNFDLEAVLYCPLFYAKPIFYKRKLAVYNFTVYEVANKIGTCFLWDECAGKRGANEIATCLSMYIESLASNVKHLPLFSDNCPGQNRNTVVAFMLYYCLNRTSLESIEIKFLEAGHTHMECDSMHSTIEAASKNAKIILPSDWYNIVRLAKKRGKPYDVHTLKYTDFRDFKLLKDSAMPNCHIDKDGNHLNWKNVRCIKFLKNTPNILFYKNEYWDSKYLELDMQYRNRGGRRRQTTLRKDPPVLYNEPLKIDSKKYKNLMELCHSNVIPNEYHRFYEDLNKNENPQQDSSSEDEITLQTMRERFKKR